MEQGRNTSFSVDYTTEIGVGTSETLATSIIQETNVSDAASNEAVPYSELVAAPRELTSSLL